MRSWLALHTKAAIPAWLAACLLAGACAEHDKLRAIDFEVSSDHSTLANGLEVLVVPNHEAPVVSALVVFRTGSATETPALSGYSHLFEHMIFKGSKQQPDPVAFRNQLAALGASNNATTHVDGVDYFFSTERSHAEAALALFAQALREPALLQTELDKEKQVVLAEFDLDESDPEFQLSRTCQQLLFGASVNRVEPLGLRSVVKAVTAEQLQDAHARFYVPNNALLVLSGDLSPAEGRRWAQLHFGTWKKRALTAAEQAPKSLPKLGASQAKVLAADVSQTVIQLAWRIPGAAEDADAARSAALLYDITLETDQDFRGLVGDGMASSAQLRFFSSHSAGYVYVEVRVPFGNERSVLQQLSGVVDLVAYGTISRRQLSAAKSQLWDSAFYTFSEPTTLPHTISSAWSSGGSSDPNDLLDTYQDATRVQLGDFVERYLRNKPHVTVLLSSSDNIAAQGINQSWLE